MLSGMTIDQYQPTGLRELIADELASKLTSEDDEGWAYIAVVHPTFTELRAIAVYDDTGEKMGYL